MKWRRLLVPLPALAGLLISVWMNSGEAAAPILRINIDIGTVMLFLGILVSILAGLAAYSFNWTKSIRVAATNDAAEDRRRFLQRLDHELKNPLTAILAGLANLSADGNETDQNASLISVEPQVKSLRDLVADLRKMADLETREIERETVDLTLLIEGVVGLIIESADLEGRKLLTSIPQAPWPLPKIQGDWDLLFLALHNLIENSVKFTAPEDTIEVRALEDNSDVVIEVAETGPGIQEDEVDEVWDELYRGKGARGIPGSGLGLALVKAIILRHGGLVNLRSRAGQGTVFSLRLPVPESLRST